MHTNHSILKVSLCGVVDEYYRQWDCTWFDHKSLFKAEVITHSTKCMAWPCKPEDQKWDHLNTCCPDITMFICIFDLPVGGGRQRQENPQMFMR